MAQALEPYDPEKVHGYRLALGECEMLLARLALMDNEQRRAVPGLHPDRAPTIVAGVLLLIEAMRAFGFEEVEVSEHDILRGAALRRAGVA
jgi:exopolyphosphatase/guanosine-5'-triphosphate,3'-diphosphate pyrophosphatase